jgi:rubrerythrin
MQRFPCARLKQSDEIYRERFHMSMIENIEYIRDTGMEDFLRKETEKWKCPECGATLCNNGICFNCGVDKLKEFIAEKRKSRD